MEDLKSFVKERYNNQFSSSDFEAAWDEYQAVEDFAPNANIWENGQDISDKAHFVMRMNTQYYIREAMKAMKMDINDPNVIEHPGSGNIGTAGRIAKTWCGFDTQDDTEFGSGRWRKPVRMAHFPNTKNTHDAVFIKTDLNASCSHHFVRFGENYADRDSFVVVGYVPREYLGGISKISRYVDSFAARRFWLQEDLCEYIGKGIEEQFKTDSVYVGIFNAQHGCSIFRGSNDKSASTTTIYRSGEFETNPDIVPPKFRG